VARHVQHEPAALAGRGLHRESGQLLERVEDLAVRPDQATRDAALLGVDDGDGGAVPVDIHVDVAVEVGDVEEGLEEVGRHLTLALELPHRGLAAGRRVGRRALGARVVVARVVDGALVRARLVGHGAVVDDVAGQSRVLLTHGLSCEVIRAGPGDGAPDAASVQVRGGRLLVRLGSLVLHR
jgi:hypothetical protein